MICDTIRVMLVMLSLAASCKAHVALTFPPARQPALDFLDSARTPPPCGVPKGTTFIFLLIIIVAITVYRYLLSLRLIY